MMLTTHMVPLGSIRFLLYSVAVVLLVVSNGCSGARHSSRPEDAEARADEAQTKSLEAYLKDNLRSPPDDSVLVASMEIFARLDSLMRAEHLAHPDTILHVSTAHGDTTYEAEFYEVEAYEPLLSGLMSDFSISFDCGIGFYATGGQLAGDAQDRFNGLGLQLSIGRGAQIELGFRGYLVDARLGNRGPVTDALKNEYELGAEMFVRYKLSPTSAFMSMYPAAGLRVGKLHWSCTSPIQVGDPGDVEEVTSDELESASIYVALGAVFNQGGRWQPEVELQVGYCSFFDYTNNGVANDLLVDQGFVQLVVALIYLTDIT
jgi:hypothetical protein